ncbi:hypothetical protein [Campylobacter hyointestinalis]|uniref:hypothetical protein n=1 Tax=Campylobacter hyointestinalis TaxID=198 RepID=UPI0011ADE811|nr:hypothetical protein [Campylobacter hyointestinalis]TWO20022.1 hypothetical protein YZ80_06365 [Campylobacter hyointestinalis]
MRKIYITKFTLNRMYNDNPELDINFDTYATNDLYLKSLIKDKYFIEEKEIDGSMVKVYDTPFGHKIMVASSSLDLKNICKKNRYKRN